MSRVETGTSALVTWSTRRQIADFLPPQGKLARQLIGAITGGTMRDNPVERIAPMLGDAGFDVAATTRVGRFLHCVRADKPGGAA